MTAWAGAAAGVARAALVCLGAGSALLGAVAVAQSSLETVHWTASLESTGAIRQGGEAIVTLSAAVEEGWHVYSFKQLQGGPIPLRVTLETNEVATADGAPSGTEPEKMHDPRFGLDTQLYSHAFTLHLPVRWASPLTAGQHVIPVSVRFQTCSDRECQPPRTIRLSVPVDVAGDG
jgi:hypothetical protein